MLLPGAGAPQEHPTHYTGRLPERKLNVVTYLAKRFFRSFITLFIILSIVFVLVRQMPVEGYFPNIDKMSPADIQRDLHMMGLDRPILVQLFDFFKELIVNGSLGVSRVYRTNVPVTTILADKIPVSVQLGSMSLCLSLLIGLPMGTMMAKYKGKLFDHIGTGYIVLINAVPAAVYYLFIQLFGSELLGINMLFIWNPPVIRWILPVISMSMGNIAYYAMWLRRYMVDESKKDYVMLARIKGANENQIMFRHIFRNSFVPLAQYIPTSFLNTVIGSIYIESLYGIPGMGGLLVDVIKRQDNNMIQGIVLLFACVGVIGLILGDLMMVILDPRISFAKKGGDR